ncbi:MAG: dehydrogenase [Burkholderiales bacterium]|nr:dehydrogenase [Burkholderiales bacterium]
MTHKIYRARAPLRLGLAGGGTDVSPFSDTHGGHVLNATIDLYAQAILEPRHDGQVLFAAEDRQEQVALPAGADLPDAEPLRLHRGIYRRVVRQFNGGRPLALTLTTYADAPAGSGLGTSSTMVVCMLQAYSEWLQLGLGEYEIAHLAFEIEREELGLAGGKQDQYAAAFGGFNFIEFGAADKVLVNPLRVKDWVISELEASTVLYYTGQSRESAHIIQRQIDNTRAGHVASLDAMLALKADAVAMKEAILRGDLARYATILGRSWTAKKQMAQGISNAGIDAVYDAAIGAGALAGKISGAGGGGFMMLFVPPGRRMGVLRELARFPGQVMNFHFTGVGAQSWALAG